MTKIYRQVFILCAVFALFLAAGCEDNTPICADNNIQKPELVYPQDEVILDKLNPFLTWKYPDSTCQPEHYRVNVATIESPPQVWTVTTSGATNGWNPASPLPPGKMYEWTVWAYNNIGSGEESLLRIFYTGPMCGLDDLHAPELIDPPLGATSHYLSPYFLWEYPDPCLPESYLVELATDLEFNNIIISDETDKPNNLWYPPAELTDCTDYFWRVAARIGDTLGPYSETYYFHPDIEDECPELIEIPPYTFTPSYNVNCRKGDNLTFGVFDVAMKATTYPIDGRNQDGSWVRIMLDSERGCWVPTISGTLSGDLSGVRVLYSLPTPTTYVDCTVYTDRASCEAQPTCQWMKPGSSVYYYCTNK